MFKNKVKQLMEIRRLTIEGLADKAELDEDTIKRARQDIRGCRRKTVEAIANALNCSPDCLMGVEKIDIDSAT